MAGHVFDRLAPLADGELAPAEAARVDAHLADCAICREAWARHEFAAGLLRQMAAVEAPADVWLSIEASLDRRTTIRLPWWRVRPVAAAAAAALIVATAAGLWWRDRSPQPWDVVRLDSSTQASRLNVGEWIETDANTTQRLGIGAIGTVDLAPGSRLQLLAARADEHRLNLARGSISAVIVAPPRIFFVETPSSTVVDLGCAYTMEVDEAGTGTLQVTQGWASLEWNGRESVVPAGASAHTRPVFGPGTPSFDDASTAMRQALLEFDFGTETRAALDVILSEARNRDTLTLWHVMSRVDPADRARVLDRMVALTPLPAAVDRRKALALDPETMRRWREELAWTW